VSLRSSGSEEAWDILQGIRVHRHCTGIELDAKAGSFLDCVHARAGKDAIACFLAVNVVLSSPLNWQGSSSCRAPAKIPAR